MNMNMQPNLTEEELINDMLNQEKQMIGSYSTFITEASCPNLRHVLITQMTQTCQDQYNIFDSMRQKGYYTGKDAPDNEVNQAKQKFQQMKSQL